MKKTIYTLAILCSSTLFAQQKLTLEKCLTIGMKNSISIKIEKLNTKQAKKQRQSFANSLLPRVNLYVNHQYNFGSTIDPSTNSRVSQSFLQDNISLSTSSELLNLENFYSLKNTKLNIEKTEITRKLAIRTYKLEIIQAFCKTLFTQELLYVQKEQIENTIQNLKRIKDEVQIGNKPKSDLYDIQLSFYQEENRMLQTKQQLEIQLHELANLLNDNGDFTNKKLENNLDTSFAFTGKNPKIQLVKIDKKMSENMVKTKKMALLPKVRLFYNISSFSFKPMNTNLVLDNFNTQLSNNKNQQVGLQLSFQLFDGFRRLKDISSANIEREKLTLKLEETKNNLKLQLKKALTKENQLSDIRVQLTKIYTSTKMSFTTSQAKFKNGRIALQLFNITKEQLLNAKYNLLKNEIELRWQKYKTQELLFQ